MTGGSKRAKIERSYKLKASTPHKSLIRAFLWLLIIPAQLVMDVILIALGAYIDSRIFDNPGVQGHGMPVFTVIMPIIALLFTIIAVIVSIVLVIISYRRRKLNS